MARSSESGGIFILPILFLIYLVYDSFNSGFPGLGIFILSVLGLGILAAVVVFIVLYRKYIKSKNDDIDIDIHGTL
ncbi:MAG: hypothetical protein II318_02725 [Bacteroidales bacterium]|nr:hypothetical protein [Bacteroidales bacterium]